MHIFFNSGKKINSKFWNQSFSLTFAFPKNRGHFYSPYFLKTSSYYIAEVAQLVEQLICNQQVAGSTPVFGSVN